MKIPRFVNPMTNPAGWLAAIGAVIAAGVVIANAVNHHGLIDVPVILAAGAAVGGLLVRTGVTPIADPHDGAGVPLVPTTALTAAISAPSLTTVPPSVVGIPVPVPTAPQAPESPQPQATPGVTSE